MDEKPTGSLGQLTHIHRGRSLCRSEVGTWAWGCCTRTPHSQSHPSRIPLGIAGNSIFPGQGRSHLKELRQRSSDHGHNNPSKARVATGLLNIPVTQKLAKAASMDANKLSRTRMRLCCCQRQAVGKFAQHQHEQTGKHGIVRPPFLVQKYMSASANQNPLGST